MRSHSEPRQPGAPGNSRTGEQFVPAPPGWLGHYWLAVPLVAIVLAFVLIYWALHDAM